MIKAVIHGMRITRYRRDSCNGCIWIVAVVHVERFEDRPILCASWAIETRLFAGSSSVFDTAQ